MKQAISIVLLVLALLVVTLAQNTQQAIKLPEKQSAQIKDLTARQAELERQFRELSLLKENLLLDAALELGLTKEKLKGLQLTSDESGALMLVPKPEQKK